MSREHLAWMDLIKGIGMCLVILGHMSVPEIFGKFIFSFHMPLFFFVSGYLAHDMGWGRFLMSKADHLVVPYCVYAVPFALIAIGGGYGAQWVWMNLAKGNGVYTTWFLSALFCSSVLGFVCIKFLKKDWQILAVSMLVAVAGVCLPWFGRHHFMSSHAWCPGTCFFLLGFLFAKRKLTSVFANGGWRVKVAIFTLFVVMGMSYLFNIRVSMAECKFGNPFLYYISAIGMIGMLFFVCSSYGGRIKVLEYMGNRSLLFMLWHAVIPTLVMIGFSRVGLDINDNSAIKAIARLLNLGLMCLIVWVIDRYAPLLAGKAYVFRLRKECRK